jgi:2-polyprenyl-3-methyl-5-hydroxy-6-metoxy-1,4-benzoquinol methylase
MSNGENRMIHKNYQDYALNHSEMLSYIKTQERYVKNLRHSDQLILDHLIRNASENHSDDISLLDMGCSTGNLLRHIQKQFPDWKLEGMDMSPKAISNCKADPELSHMSFYEGDLLYFSPKEPFDFITISAVFFALDKIACKQAINNIAKALKPNGTVVVFDYFNQFEQELFIQEFTELHPDGLPIYMRPHSFYESELKSAGFSKIQIEPFEIGLDLPFPSSLSKTDTYTVLDKEGQRMQFRGALYQPWGHLIAQK